MDPKELVTLITGFKDLDFSTSGVTRLEEVLQFIDGMALRLTYERGIPLEQAAEVQEAVKKELLEKLTYLDRYGEDRYRVGIGRDVTPLGFALTWKARGEGGVYTPLMYGVLQCDFVRQTFGSVVIGDVTYWSIHT
mgnify:CR=1 FL=1